MTGTSAAEIRSAALALVATHGDWKQIGPVRGQVAKVGGFVLWHWTPFGIGARSLDEARQIKRDMRRWGETPPLERTYGLEIWWRLLGKVACLEWDNADPPDAVVLRPGPWQHDLLRLVETGGIEKRDPGF